jgi:hypothetical protein
MHDLDLPRVAIYSIWGNTQDVGWVRYAFDKFEIPYDLIFKERVKKGDLKGAYDVVVMPNQGGSGKRRVSTSRAAASRSSTRRARSSSISGCTGESDDITAAWDSKASRSSRSS